MYNDLATFGLPPAYSELLLFSVSSMTERIRARVVTSRDQTSNPTLVALLRPWIKSFMTIISAW